MNTSHIIIVGLISGLVTIGTAYFILKKLTDFQWWWLAALFGAQFLTVILVSYILDQNFGCSAKATVSCNNQQTIDWCNLRKAAADAPPKIISKSLASTDDGVNAADWQDLLQQLDQISKEPAVITASDSGNNNTCPQAVSAAAQPATTTTFDFSSFAKTLSLTTPITSTSDTTAASTKAASLASAPTVQGIDFASLFR